MRLVLIEMATSPTISQGIRIATFNMKGFKSNWSYLKDLLQSNDIIFCSGVVASGV